MRLTTEIKNEIDLVETQIVTHDHEWQLGIDEGPNPSVIFCDGCGLTLRVRERLLEVSNEGTLCHKLFNLQQEEYQALIARQKISKNCNWDSNEVKIVECARCEKERKCLLFWRNWDQFAIAGKKRDDGWYPEYWC